MNLAAPQTSLRIAVRPMRAGDEPFVFRGWLKACRRCPRHRNLPPAVYYGEVHAELERLLAAPVVNVWMATAPDDAGVLFGFLCTEQLGGRPLVLHFAYTKREARQRGVFRQLAAGAGLNLARPFFYTAYTHLGSVMAEVFPTAIYRRDVLALPR